MTKQEAKELFWKIRDNYWRIKPPKYRNVDLQKLKQEYESLLGIKEHLREDVTFIGLINSMSQTISKLSTKPPWSNVSERGINKAIRPAVRKASKDYDFPVEWVDKWGHRCYINNGYWNAKSYMVMDVLGYMFLLREGGDCLPKETKPIFSDLDSIKLREAQLSKTSSAQGGNQPGSPSTVQSIISTQKYYVKFRDRDFRKFTGLALNSNDILKLLLETSRVEFKLSFPVRVQSQGKKENLYTMNVFSRFFELSYIDKEVRRDGIVQAREYTVTFTTLLGELFVNNLKSRHIGIIDSSFYTLPDSAQIFYRRFFLHNNYTQMELNLGTIVYSVGLENQNITNLLGTVETIILQSLKERGLIESYEKENGLQGIKYIIKRANAKGGYLLENGSGLK